MVCVQHKRLNLGRQSDLTCAQARFDTLSNCGRFAQNHRCSSRRAHQDKAEVDRLLVVFFGIGALPGGEARLQGLFCIIIDECYDVVTLNGGRTAGVPF